MSPENAAALVAELELFRPQMTKRDIIEFESCIRLLQNPHATNREWGYRLLLQFSTRFVRSPEN